MDKPPTISQVMWELMSEQQRAALVYRELIHRLSDRKDLFKPDGRKRRLKDQPLTNPNLNDPRTWTFKPPLPEYTPSPDDIKVRIHVCMLDTYFALMSVDDPNSREQALLSISEALFLYEGKEFKGQLYE